MVMSIYWVAAILFFASFVQGVVGFAMVMFAVPLLLGLDLPLPQCVALALTASTLQSLAGSRQLREDMPWNRVRRSAFWRIVAIPLGTWFLVFLSKLDLVEVKAVVGGFILLAVLAQLKARPVASQRDWMIPASLLSGFTLGALGMGGPPIVLWVLTQDWTTRKVRGFLFGLSLICNPIALLTLTLNAATSDAILTGVLAGPVILGGSYLGVRVGNRLPKSRLQKLALAVLAFLALKLIVPALFY